MDEMAVDVCFFFCSVFFCYFMDLFIPSGPSLTPSTERSQDFDDQKKTYGDDYQFGHTQ